MIPEMPAKPTTVLDRTLYDSLYAQVQKGSLSKENAYDQIVTHVEGTTLDLPSIAKLWDSNDINDSKDPPSVYSKIQLVLTKLVEVLQQHKTAVRIGHVFKDHFMTIWTQVLKELECHEITDTIRQWIAENVTKPILQVRDIRWILKDLEGYIIRSRLFEFSKYGIVAKSETMSRDNFYIVKKYIEDEEERKLSYYNSKWTICSNCAMGDIECIKIALEKEAPFNIRDQPSNQTDELWVALKYNNVKVINFLCEYEEKEGRPIVFIEEHAKYLRKLGHLDTLRALMPQFLTKEEKDEINPPPPVPRLEEIAHDQFYEKLSSGTELYKVNDELLFVDKPMNIKYFKYKNTTDSVILFYNKDTDLSKIEPELLELQKRVPKISFGKTTFDPPYYKFRGTNYYITFFRKGCSLHNTYENVSSDDLHQRIQMMFYQTTIIPENEEFGKLRKKFENIPSDAKMTMTDVKEYMSYNAQKYRYENQLTTILPCDDPKTDHYCTESVFESISSTEDEVNEAGMSRTDEDYERKKRAQEAKELFHAPKKPSVFKSINVDKENDTDTSNPNTFMYSRTIFSRLKKRYGTPDKAVPDDNEVPSGYSGWFSNHLETNPFEPSNPFNQEISTLLKTFPTKDTPVKDIILIDPESKESKEDEISEYSVLTKDEIDKIFESQL